MNNEIISLHIEIEELQDEIKTLLKENSNKEKVIRKYEEMRNKAIEDLERTLEVNKHYKDNYNEWINVDIDHIKYLLEILKGEDNE